MMDELCLVEMNDVNTRWVENGNPLGSLSVTLPTAAPQLLVGPYGVTIDANPSALSKKHVSDAHRLKKTREACDEAWGDDRDAARRCTVRTHGIETALWRGTMSLEQAEAAIRDEWAVPEREPGFDPGEGPPRVPPADPGRILDVLKGPVGAIVLAIGATILILATRPRA